jgi:hypothetical protein
MYKNRLLIVVSFLLLISCENPFLPETGVPLNVSNPRSTPAGVISQLFQSYETRRIELFTSVLSKKFKFYVASGFDIITTLNPEKPDTFMEYVDKNSSYNYWEYDEEYKRTSKIFENAEMIEIPSRPAISNTHYIFDSSGDTIYAEIKVNNVTFEVSKYESNTLVTYSLENQPQVFLLERDEDNLWVIKKWYDLGSE